MELTMLGTGNAMAVNCYNTCFVLNDDGKYFMVDAGGGNGILRRLREAGIDPKDIHHIFVTHKHIDHLLGLIWMVRVICQSMGGDSYDGDAWIYAHDEVIGLIRDLAAALLTKKQSRFMDERLHLKEVKDGEKLQINGREFTFFDIQSTKAKQFGFSMDLGNGEKLSCCGDEPYNPCERKYAEGSRWLLHEAFCLDSEADIFKPYDKHHSTVKDACELAEELHVRNLVLYHTEDTNLAHRREWYTAEGQQYYHGNLVVPEDMEKIRIL